MKKKALAVVLTLMMVVSILPMAAFAAEFSDVSADFWARDAINRWTDEGILQGVGDNMFAPNDTLTRAQAAAIFTRLLQLTDAADVSNFTDVEADSWYAPYVACAVAAGIMNGTSATTFNPNGTITRQDFFLILARAVGIKEQYSCNYTKFDDLNQLSGYARGSVYALINLDYVHGRSETELAPLAPITRASAAQVLDNVIQYYITEDGSYDVSGDGVALVLAKNVALNGNFSGTVVGSAEDSVVDLAGVTQPVTAIANKDNVQFVNAHPQSRVNSNASGTTVNGTPVAEDTTYTVPGGETPEQPVINGGGGGTGNPHSQGGQGSGGATYGANLVVTLSKDTAGRPNTFTLTATGIADTGNVDDVFNALISGGENQLAMTNALNFFLGNFQGTKSYTSSDGHEIVVTISPAHELTMTDNGAAVTDLNKFIEGEQLVFEQQRDYAAAQAGMNTTGNAYSYWVAFTDAFSPKSQFKTVSGSKLTLGDASYYIGKITEMVNNFALFRAEAIMENVDFEKLFDDTNGIVQTGAPADLANLLLNGDTLASVAGSAVQLVNASLSGATIGTIEGIVGNYTNTAGQSWSYFNPAYEGTSYAPYAWASWNTATAKDGVKGLYTATLTIVQE